MSVQLHLDYFIQRIVVVDADGFDRQLPANHFCCYYYCAGRLLLLLCQWEMGRDSDNNLGYG